MATFSLQIGADLLPTAAGTGGSRGTLGDTVQITETAGGSNSILRWTMWDTQTPYTNSWMGKLSQNVLFKDLTNARTLFQGNLVNVVRRQTGAHTRFYELTAIGYNAWLDRLMIPKWVSKRPSGVAMTSDREMINSVSSALGATPVGNFAFSVSNALVAETNTSMPLVTMNQGGSVGSILQAIADAASTVADPTPRQFYIDMDAKLHYFKGSESLTAPYLVGDAQYIATVTGTSGLVSLWQFVESGGTSVADTQSYAAATLNGGYTRGQSYIVPNTNLSYAVLFNGSTGYATASGANLHQGDGPWSVELWFKRSSTLGTAQTMVSAGTSDYEIGFTAANEIVVYKEGTGNNFVTNATYTDTNAHHLVVVRPNGGPTVVYVDGNAKAGTTTARTFSSAAGAVNIGRRLSSTDRYFSGTLQHVAIYSSAMNAATALDHYNDGWTIRPYEFEFETDVNDSGKAVWVKGTSNSGWVYLAGNSNYSQSFMLDTGQDLTVNKRDAIGTAFLKGTAAPLMGGEFSVALFDGWRANQTLTINDAALGVDGADANIPTTYQIRQVDTTFELGSGQRNYRIAFGTLPWSGTFAVQKKRRSGSGATSGTTGTV